MSDLRDKYVQMAESKDKSTIDSSNFLLPDMGEMVQEDLMQEIYQQYINGDVNSAEYKEKEVLDAAYYTEEPFSTVPGHYPEKGAFVLKVKDWKKKSVAWKINKYDGDTIDFELKNIDDGDEAVVLTKNSTLTYKNFKEYFKKMGGGSSIQIRFLGIDAAEIPHYEIQPVKKNSDRVIEVTYKKMLEMINSNVTVIYEKCPYDRESLTFIERKDDDKVKLLLTSDESSSKKTYAEIITRLNGKSLYESLSDQNKIDKNYNYHVILAKEESESNKIEDGYKAQAVLRKIIDSPLTTEMMLVINANGIAADRQVTNNVKTFNSIYYLDDVAEYMLDEWDTYYKDLAETNYSYIPYGMDNYKRSLGVIYAKYNGKWINVNKYVLCNTEMTIADPSFTSSPELQQIGAGINDSFNLWSYRRDNIEWLDSFNKISSKYYDEKIELHKKLTGIDFTQVRDCALMIGDTLMLIPPESIRNITQLSYERIPNMRSKGTMTKNKGNADHMLEITLYFYEDAGINGIDYQYTTPNNTTFNYKMNGLRSLIAQFKIAPFLPIENGFINDVLGIEAVALMNMNISNVEGYPRLLKVILTLREFNYRLYMPDMPISEKKEDENSISQMNPFFAKCFNWEIFRYYYQRSIMAGNDLAIIEEYDGITSYNYNLQYYTNKNAIGPWLFCGNSLRANGEISFYIPDEDWLKAALQVKKDRDDYQLTNEANVTLSAEAQQYVTKLAQLAYTINEIRTSKNEELAEVLNDLFTGVRNKKHTLEALDITLDKKVTTESIDNIGTIYVKYTKDGEGIPNGQILRIEYINPIKKAIWDKLNNANYIKNATVNEVVSKSTENIICVRWDICLQLNLEDITDDDWRDIREILAKRLELKPDNIFKKDLIRLSYKMFFEKKDKKYSIVIPSSDDIDNGYVNTFIPEKHNDEKALEYLINHIKDDTELNPDAVEDELENITDDALNEYNAEIDFYVKDYKNPANLPFVPYIENVLCKSMMGNISNSFTDITLKAIEGNAPQYMGGQDTQLQFELISDDIAIVGALNNLPTLASAMAKKYRKVLPAWPIKIQSELTKMLGVSEVLIDMIEVSTIEGFPGVYSIVMRLTSVDRTQRQREALRRLDVAPQGGRVGYNHNSDLSIKNYFALDNQLAQAELYPDLDIPTLDELGQLGFRFVKYSGQHRSYPDPDFYICYNYAYTSLIIKKIVKDALSQNLLNEEGDESLHSFTFKDTMGAELTGKIESYTGLTLKKLNNDKAKSYNEIITELEEQINDSLAGLSEKKKKIITEKLELKAAVNNMLLVDVLSGWEVRPSWRASLADEELNNIIKNVTKDKPNVFAEEIKKRRKEAIELIDKILSKPLKYRDSDLTADYTDTMIGGSMVQNQKDKDSKYKLICEDAVNGMFGSGDGLKLIELLCPGMEGFDKNQGTGFCNTFYSSYFTTPEPLAYLIGFLFSSGCALSADKEYNSKLEYYDWYPNHYISNLSHQSYDDDPKSKYYKQKLPYCISEKVAGSPKVITSIEDGIANGTVFGAWRITKYSSPQVISSMVEKELDDSIKYTKNDKLYDKVKAGYIDPYYNKLNSNNEEYKNYQKSILINKQCNAEAFLRNVLVYLRKMIVDGLLISEIDILANDWNQFYKTEFSYGYDDGSEKVDWSVDAYDKEIADKLLELGFDPDSLHNMLDSLKISTSRTFCVRLIYPFLLAITERSDDIYNIIKRRDYNSLNGLTGYVEYGSGTKESKTKVVKFLSALSGTTLSLNKSSDKNSSSESQKVMNNLVKDIFIKASEDPRTYLMHSFYDMLTSDKRGRLVRAFPTYYMVFIDEGRKYGSWKLHDNFYNMNAISSINIVKSRKIAADTCTIVMSNMFNSYTMEPDSTTTQQYTDLYGLRDVFDSIFSPQAYFDKEKRIRLRKTVPDTVVLQPGVRIHVRMGYSADGSKLPVCFNGKIAEVDVAEVAQIVAQGDGHELMNPLNVFGEIEATELDVVQSTVTWFKDLRGAITDGGESPRDLLAIILTAKYGGIRKMFDKLSDGRWFNDNPFGITHFGDPKFAKIFEQGEVVQNLYEVADTSLLKGMYDFTSDVTSKKTSPTINTSIQDKTFWDLLHLAANSGLNYIGAVRDFGFRSTIFLGKPNHYYAYAYDLIDGRIVEKRKPFQQFHYYDSYTDIVYNSIKASEAQMKTNAVGTWQATSTWWGREQATVGPIYLDMNIYPEYQKSMTVDTGLLGSGNGWIDINFTTHFGEKFSTDANDDKVNKALATRVTANALKNSVKDMYQGDLCVLGDPSVKPYDRIYIHDTYEDMQGMFEVEAVVHSMNADTGFTTSILPDVIARHEDKSEAAVQSLMSTAGALLATGVGMVIVDRLWGAAVHGKLATLIAKSSKYDKTVKLAKIANNFYEATGMKEFLDNHPAAKSVFSKFNVAPSATNLTLEGINTSINYLEKLTIKKLDSYDDIAKAFMHYARLDMDEYKKGITDAITNNKYGITKKDYKDMSKIDDAYKAAKDAKDALDKSLDFSKFNMKEFADDIFKIKIDNVQLNKLTSQEVNKILKSWSAGKFDESMDAAKQIAKVMQDEEILKAIKNGTLKTDKIDDFFNGFKTLFKKVDGEDVTKFAKVAKTLKLGDTLGDLLSVVKGLVKTNWVGLLIDLAIETGVYILTKNTQEVFTSFLKSIQAVDVYPLMKNNKPLIAGMNGHKGSVRGWPVKDGFNSIQGMIMQFTQSIKDLDGDLPIADFFLDLFVDSQVLSDLSEEWKYELGIEETGEMTEEEIAQATYENIASMYAANNKQGYALSTTPRITANQLKGKDGGKDILKTYQITNLQQSSIQYSDKVLDLVFINKSAIIRKAIIDERFVIAHDENSDATIIIPFESGTEAVPVKIKNNIIDMPLVQEELLYILENILETDAMQDEKVTFKSGVRINDVAGAWKSTGYQMILETKGLDVLTKELDKLKKSSNLIKDSDGLFKYEANESKNKVSIIVYPPLNNQ